jgi:branched-chain amino acid transport system permease protein
MSNELILVLFGLSLGAIYALLVLGLVVTYRMSKFLNLAHGAMGMFVTHIHWQLTVEWGLSQWISLPLCVLVIAPLFGVAVGRLLYRPLLARDDSAKIAGSVVVVTLLTELVARIWGSRPGELPRTLPRSSFAIGDAYFGWDRVIIIVLAVGAAVGLGLLLTRTRFGASIRGVAENRATAGLFGIDVDRVETIGWAIATALAALAGILISELGTVNALQLTFLVIAALAAAAVGRLTSIVGAMVGAALLGVTQSEMSRLPADFVARFGSLPAAAPFLLLLAALFVLRRLKLDVGGGDIDQTGGRRQALPRQSGTLKLAAGLRSTVARTSIPTRLLSITVMSAAVATIAWVVGRAVDSTWLFLLTTAAIFTVAFASIALLNGLGGQISLCQASFMGVGALAAAKVQQTCTDNPISGRPECTVLTSGWRIWGGLLLAGLVAGLVGLLVATLTSRVRGVMLAVVTLSFGFFLDQTLFPSRDVAGGEFGYIMQRPTGFEAPVAFFILTSIVAAGAIWLARNLARSGTGRVMRLTEQSPTAAQAFGFAAPQYKLVVFGLSAAIAGVAGALYGSLLESFQGLNYNSLTSLLLFLIVFAIGSRRTFAPLAAALAYTVVPKLLSYSDVTADYGNLVFAVGALGALALPGGVLGWLSVRRAEVAHERAEDLDLAAVR